MDLGFRKNDWSGGRHAGVGNTYRVDKTMCVKVTLQGESEEGKGKRAEK